MNRHARGFGWVRRLRLGEAMVLAVAMLGFPAQAQQTSTTRYEYDAQGNLKKITDPRGMVTHLPSYDALNRLNQVIQPPPMAGQPSPSIGFGYDGLDQLQWVIDPKGLTTGYTMDGLGNLNLQSSPDSGGTQNTYDAAGNLTQRTDARGKITAYQYDALNRVNLITFSDATPPMAFSYDVGAHAKGKRVGMQDAAGTTLWGYDSLGRVNAKLQAQGSIAHSVYYSWGQSGTGKGRLDGIQYPSGMALYRQYDSAGRLELIVLITPAQQVIPLYYVLNFSPFGPPTGMVWLHNSVARSALYDLDGRLAAYSRDNDLRVLTYDAAGRIENVKRYSNQSTVEAYGYDDLNRLTQWQAGAVTQNYGYDASGNRTSLEIIPTTPAYTYSYPATSHKLSSTTGPSPAKNNTYDLAGNLEADGTVTYIHDARGRMIQATKGSVVTDYTVNGLGQRVRKTVNSGPQAGTTYYVYDEEGHLLGEYDGSGNIIQEYVWYGDTPVVLMKGPVSSPLLYSIETDHLGTPRQVRDVNQALRWQWDPDAFGNAPPDENPASLGAFTMNMRFPGQYFDKETNLHYNYYRDYDPAIGRYIQSDPIGVSGLVTRQRNVSQYENEALQGVSSRIMRMVPAPVSPMPVIGHAGVNLYAYVDGNPISYIDPSGEFGLAIGVAIFAGAVAVGHYGADYIFGGELGWWADRANLYGQMADQASRICQHNPWSDACRQEQELYRQQQMCISHTPKEGAGIPRLSMPTRPFLPRR